MTTLLRYMAVLTTLALSAVVAATATAPAASTSTTVVGVDVPSATSLDSSGCAANVPNRTHFGTVQPGALAVTSLDCTVSFGSSNDIGRLRVAQTDGLNLALFQATRGALYTGFDGDGRATTTFGGGGNDDQYFFIEEQPDGKVYAAGYCNMGGPGVDFCTARYNANGSLDVTFDGDGRVTTSIGAGAASDQAVVLSVQPDGKVIVSGWCDMGGTGIDMCAVRYNTNGSLDGTFDGDGQVTVTVGAGANDDYGAMDGLMPDGRMVFVGSCDMGASGFDFCVVRLNADGSLDTTFDGDGRTTVSVGAGGANDGGLGELLPDGRILGGGSCNMGGTGDDLCAIRLNTDGSLDTTFDGDGKNSTAIAPGGGADTVDEVVLQSDGKFVIAGGCAMGGVTGQDICLARFTTTGAVDATFDTDGEVTTPIAPGAGSDIAFGVEQQPDGKLVVAGPCQVTAPNGVDYCLARYETNGALDTTFDGDGKLSTSIGAGAAADTADTIDVASDGRLLVGGYCDMGGSGDDGCIVAYTNAGTMSQYVNTTTDWDTAGTSLFGACLSSVTNATATWTANAGCPATDGAYWNAVPTTATQIAAANANQPAAVANLRFGVRNAPSQTPGAYVAPITFDVVAP